MQDRWSRDMGSSLAFDLMCSCQLLDVDGDRGSDAQPEQQSHGLW